MNEPLKTTITLDNNNPQNEFIIEWVLRLPNEQADNLLVEMVACEMRKKLKKKRDEGRYGWFGPNCSNRDLFKMLEDHMEKGDMIDVINFSAMILARHKLYGEAA